MLNKIIKANYQPDVLTGKINTSPLNLKYKIIKTENGWNDGRTLKVQFVRGDEIWFLNEVTPISQKDTQGDLILDGQKIELADLLAELKIKNNYIPDSFHRKS